MSIEAKNRPAIVDSPRPPCRVCDDPPHTAFNWEYARRNRTHKLHALFEQLRPVQTLKFGHLYVCQICGLNWVLEEDHYAMTRVPGDRLEILKEWNESQLPIDQEPRRVLEAIGGTAPKYWMGHDRVIAIPCAISTDSGERVDPALVWITKRPPIDGFIRRVRLFRKIRTVEPSDFALPIDVRWATLIAPEIRMGFAPTRVVATNGTPFVLHWATSLFNQDGVTGREVRLSAEPFEKDESIPIAETDMIHATYFFADWFEGAENLSKPQPKVSPGSKLHSFWKRFF